MTDTPRKGRPPLPPEERQSVAIQIRVTPAERERITEALAPDSVSGVARGLLLREVRRREKKAGAR